MEDGSVVEIEATDEDAAIDIAIQLVMEFDLDV
jgi:hypothetical protein